MVVVVDPGPAEQVGGPAATGHPVEVAGEVVGEPQQELLRRGDPVLREGEDRVLLRVRGDDVAVVALGVGRLEVAAQLRRDVEVDDLVTGGVANDADDAVLRLAVLVGGEDDLGHGWVLSNGRGWCGRTSMSWLGGSTRLSCPDTSCRRTGWGGVG